MMFSFSKVVASSLSTYSGKKLGGADNELLLLTLQHNRGFAGSQRSPALNRIRLTQESNLLPWIEPTEFQVIRLRIDFFHSNCV
jgi:glycine/serine hydroxymethyltransferase